MIDSIKVGEIIYNDQKFKDLKIINKKPQEWTWKKDHTVTLEDIQDMLEDIDILVIGTGQEGRITIEKEVLKACAEKHIHIHVHKTPTAVRIYNEIEGHHTTGAIIHSTC